MVSNATATGMCTFWAGSGTLAGFNAIVDVTLDPDSGRFHWDGTYLFTPVRTDVLRLPDLTLGGFRTDRSTRPGDLSTLTCEFAGPRFGARRSSPLVRRATKEVQMYRIHRSLAIAGAVAALVRAPRGPRSEPSRKPLDGCDRRDRRPGDPSMPAIGAIPMVGRTSWVAPDGAAVTRPPMAASYVVNAGTSEVWHTGEYAEPIARWGQKGTGPGQFDFERDPKPTDGLDFGGVATSPLGGPFGNVYVADSGNDRVQEFDHNGVFIRQWGTTGTDTTTSHPRAVAHCAVIHTIKGGSVCTLAFLVDVFFLHTQTF